MDQLQYREMPSARFSMVSKIRSMQQPKGITTTSGKNVANHSIKRSNSFTTSKSRNNGPFSKRQKQKSKSSTTSKTVQKRQGGKMDKMFCPIVPQQYKAECLVDTMREYHTEYTTTSMIVHDRQCRKMD